MYAGSTAPTGYLLCDGTAVSRTTYADLFAVTSTTYGVGNGTTTFNVPNLQDRIPIGTSGTRALGTTGGASTYTLTVSNIPQHSHSIDHDHASFTSGAGSAHSHGSTLSAPAHTHTTNITHGHSDNFSAPAHTHSINPPNTSTTSDAHSHSIPNRPTVPGSTSGNTIESWTTGTGTARTLNTGSDSHAHTMDIAAFDSAGASSTTISGQVTDLGATATTSSGASATALTGSISDESLHTHSIDVPAFTGTSGNYGTASPTAVDIIPPYLSLNYIIKV